MPISCCGIRHILSETPYHPDVTSIELNGTYLENNDLSKFMTHVAFGNVQEGKRGDNRTNRYILSETPYYLGATFMGLNGTYSENSKLSKFMTHVAFGNVQEGKRGDNRTDRFI
jgi:hypothetical protein